MEKNEAETPFSESRLKIDRSSLRHLFLEQILHSDYPVEAGGIFVSFLHLAQTNKTVVPVDDKIYLSIGRDVPWRFLRNHPVNSQGVLSK